MRHMQVVQWGEAMEVREYPMPEPTGCEVLIRITACGVCHSDLHLWSGFFDLGNGEKISVESRGVSLPFTLGHEPIGEVVAMGPEAEGVAIGDQRIVYPWIGCGDCDVCLAGDELLCLKPRVIGTRVNGGYASHVICPDPKYLVDYAGISTALACTYACSGITAFSALKKVSHLTEKDYLMTIGAGGVGLNGVHLAAAVTPAKLIVADIDGTKRAAARQAGAVETIDNNDPDAVAKVMEITGGGVGATIDFVGAPKTAKFGIDSLRKGGLQVQVGLFGDALSMSMPLFPLKMITLQGSYVGTLEDLKELIGLAQAGKVPPIPVASRPLEEANEVFDDMINGRILGRVVLTP